jgi:pimeloyl-ACP methyl ester carboxylesterase
MPVLDTGEATIEYAVYGEGYPLALFAPGGMHSIAQMWAQYSASPGQPPPWFDPRTALADHFTVIAMDQRNSGGSSAAIRPDDGWSSYAADQIAVVDQISRGQTHLMGGCIGASYCLGFIQAAPGRVTAAVLQNPIGLTDDNRDYYGSMFDRWAVELKVRRTDLDDDALGLLRHTMFGGDFVFSVDRDFVRQCDVPLLILAGNEKSHPREVAEEIADLAPSGELVFDWTGPDRYGETRQRVLDFLLAHTPR